jgi:glycosyltransferase involved in cell wall biosynthesis
LRKGQDLVLRAIKILQEKYPDIMLINCWYNKWPESAKLMTYSQYIKFEYQNQRWQDLMNHTYALNGLDPARIQTLVLVANAKQREIYQHTDLGVFPNRCEGGTNLVLMEYMACGKPVIASNTSGHKDIVSPQNALLLNDLRDIHIMGPDGRLIARWQEPSVDELVAQIEYAYHHREKIKTIGQRAGTDLKKFTWARSARQLLDLMGL